MSSKKRQAPHRALTLQQALGIYRDSLREALGRSGKTLAAMRRALDEYGAGVLDTPDEAVKVWSDLHLGHANIIRFHDRPYQNVHKMNAALWTSWQLGVKPAETLVCVGDFAMGHARTSETWDIVRTAPGRSKILVLGNHDIGHSGARQAHGFHRYKALLVSPGDPPLIWTHAPLPDVPAGHVNVHGHRHSLIGPRGSPHINVSVEQLDYRPVSLARVRSLARTILAGQGPEGATTLERIAAVEGGGDALSRQSHRASRRSRLARA